MWVLGIELRLSGLYRKYFFLLGSLIGQEAVFSNRVLLLQIDFCCWRIFRTKIVEVKILGRFGRQGWILWEVAYAATGSIKIGRSFVETRSSVVLFLIKPSICPCLYFCICYFLSIAGRNLWVCARSFA